MVQFTTESITADETVYRRRGWVGEGGGGGGGDGGRDGEEREGRGSGKERVNTGRFIYELDLVFLLFLLINGQICVDIEERNITP